MEHLRARRGQGPQPSGPSSGESDRARRSATAGDQDRHPGKIPQTSGEEVRGGEGGGEGGVSSPVR